MSGATELRRMLKAGETIVAPGAYDAITARIGKYLGFKALYVGGNQTGLHLCTTEPLTTLTEMVEVAGRVVQASGDMPVIADAGAGYGDPVQTVRAVREFEHRGIAGIHIEDQVYPKRVAYHAGVEHIVPLEEFLDRIRYALRARKDKDFVIIARTDAVRAVEGSREEALRRTRAAVEAGADALLLVGMSGIEDYKYFREQIPRRVPMMGLVGFGPLSVTELEKLGYQLIVFPTTTINAAIAAIIKEYEAVKATGRPATPEAEATRLRQIVEELAGFQELWQIESATTEKEQRPQ